MGRVICIIVLAVAFAGCASSKPTGVQDGTSFENAVVTKNANTEYEWVGEHYPSGRVTDKALITKGRKDYDVLSVELSDGTVKRVYFYHPIP